MAGGTFTGKGTSLEPYRIEDVQDFMAMLDLSTTNKYVVLDGDIDFSSLGTLTTNLKTGSIVSLNGMNHTVKNLRIEAPTIQVGFISHVGTCAVQNLVVENFNFNCNSGGFLKRGSYDSNSHPVVSFTNVHVKNSKMVSTSTCGFMVDYCYSSSGGIKYCSFENCEIISDGYVGFVGGGGYKSIRDSYARNCVIRAGSHIGFLGYKNWTGSPIIQNCYIHGELYFSKVEFNKMYLGSDNGNSNMYNSDVRSCAVIPTKLAVTSTINNNTNASILVFGKYSVHNCFYVPVPIVVGEYNG